MIENTRSFDPDVYEGRRIRLQESLRSDGLAGALITSKANRIYYTGFGPDSGSLNRFVALCVPAEGEVTYVVSDIDKDRTTQVGVRTLPAAYGEGVRLAADTISDWEAGELAVESGELTLLAAEAIRLATDRVLAHADIYLATLRSVKTAEEIEVLRIASRHTDAVAKEARNLIREGMTERELSGSMVQFAMSRGCDISQVPLVLTGERAMFPHLLPSDREFRSGELVVVDYGVGFGGYETDICRTYSIGEPSSFAVELHGIVSEAYDAALKAAQPGNTAEDVHIAAYEVIEKAGYGRYFIHGVGHGVGIESHEPPLLSFGQKTPLRDGMVLAIEPGIYTQGIGLRLENNVVVRHGGGQSLNDAPMHL